MNTIKTVSYLTVVISVISIGTTGCYKPNIPMENIPFDVPADVREKIKGMYSWNPLKRRYAVVQLGQMGARAAPAIPFLIGALDDRIWLGWLGLTRTNEEATKALVKIGEPAVSPLISSLKVENRRIRVRAALALGEIKDSRAVKPLITTLKDKDHVIRASAVVALAKINDLRVMEPLLISLKDEDAFVRIAAAKALGNLKDTRIAKTLIAALKDEDFDVQRNVVKALVEIKDPQTVEPLIDALRDENPRVRRWAAVALGGLRDIRAVEPLINALRDEKLLVRVKSAYALYEITGKDLGRDPEKWQKWWAKNKPR
ncbi:MAG: heat repeat-containing PBS lyase [Candidatus Scalindua rubra]|uniref:Heat repeat-containing PBS lyase n=1 Tax=Candidatus Scalindua rubra TaxID=1872076 RepID=A0A1E3XDI1_9BACT|nr:MAG: heat repeat-containing PBS lyase [Candidatus Scalindua rubra]